MHISQEITEEQKGQKNNIKGQLQVRDRGLDDGGPGLQRCGGIGNVVRNQKPQDLIGNWIWNERGKCQGRLTPGFLIWASGW